MAIAHAQAQHRSLPNRPPSGRQFPGGSHLPSDVQRVTAHTVGIVPLKSFHGEDGRLGAQNPVATEARHKSNGRRPGFPTHHALQRRRDIVFAGVQLSSTLMLSIFALPSFAADSARVRDAKMVARILALRGSVPQGWVSDFRTALEGYGIVAVSYKSTLLDLWRELNGSGKNNAKTTVDAITVGDAYLQKAIEDGLIQPIDSIENYRYWGALNSRWRRLVTRGHDVYGVPYRWGCTVVVYRKDRLRKVSLADWDDLLNSSLTKKVALMDNPREIVGIALKSLGLQYNSTAADAVRCGITPDDLRRRVSNLVHQAKVISNKDHVRAYAAGDVDVIVGSSDDLIPLAQKSSNSVIVIPASGTALFADFWCVPTGAAGGAEDGTPSPLLPAWFELCVSPSRADSASGLSRGASPLLLPNENRSKSRYCSPIRDSHVEQLIMGSRELPSVEVLQRSEFLEEVSDEDTLEMYRASLQ
jgi:spermidine/putrescine-binding protein